MQHILKVNVPLKRVEAIVLDYYKNKYKDNNLKIATRKCMNKILMRAYSTKEKFDFDIERLILINEEDIRNIFSPILKEEGLEINSFCWEGIYLEDIILCFSVNEFENEEEINKTLEKKKGLRKNV